MAAEHDFGCDQGTYWSQQLIWYDESGTNPIDISTWHARMQIRRQVQAGEYLIQLTDDPGDGITLGGADGTILLEMSAEQTADLPAVKGGNRHYYDLEMVPADGKVRRLVQGRFLVSAEVTR
jgi:hypothetical protein